MNMMFAVVSFLVAGATVIQPDTREWSQVPFLGLAARDTPDGTVVGWVYPGPLMGVAGGAGGPAADVRRSDNLVSVQIAGVSHAIDSAKRLTDLIAGMHPGDSLTLVVRRSPEADPNAAVPKGGAGGEERAYTVTLGSKDEWSGTLGRGLAARTIAPPEVGSFEPMILDDAAKLGMRAADGGLDPLLANLRDVQDRAIDPNSLGIVVNAFRRPLALDRQEQAVYAAVLEMITTAQRVSAAPEVEGIPERLRTRDDWLAIERLVDLVLQPSRAGDQGALLAPVANPPAEAPRAMALVRHLRDDVSPGGPEIMDQLRAMRLGHDLFARDTFHRMLHDVAGAMIARSRNEEVQIRKSQREGVAYTPVKPSEELARAVQGDVYAVSKDPPSGRFRIVGGPGPNIYDMSLVASVIDLGGDDHYRFSGTTPPGPAETIITDLEGDDIYESTSDFAGPGVGVFGVSIIDDVAGNDRYISHNQFSIAAGLFGVGIILDRAGDDTYENTGPASGWAQGVGFYGVGLLIDLKGNDTYHGEKLCQGVGGPRGFGAIIDAEGDDSYVANGPNFGSVYGTPGVYVAMSQGFGYGARGYAAGGLGAIFDLRGKDHYVAGEFSQGCGYFFAMGLIHDAEGDDVYDGNRYSQAASAHQAIGMLIDDAGDDKYSAMTAASQGSAWDQSIGMLIDRSGNDTYKADGLAQGSAAMQAIALLIDLDGADSYTGAGDAVQGCSGDNTYHYDADRVFSFSGLFDLGGKEDKYSSGRTNGQAVRTGAKNEKSPASSTLHGVFVDR